MPNLRGTSTMLIGPTGTGKTYSLSTFIEAGLKLAVVFTDPGGDESFLDSMNDRGLPLDNAHWRYIAPASPPWSALEEMAKKIGSMGYEDLTKIKSGIAKREYNQFVQLLATFANFTCEHCGLEIGPVDKLSSEWAVGLDGLSGLNVMAMDMTIGGKPAAHQGEWGVAMNAEEKLVSKLTSDLVAFFFLSAHVERELNEAAGYTQLMASALGRKLAPKLPRTFSDVVLARREGDKFFWSTTAMNVDLKTRTLPLSDTLQPSFVQIVDRWRQRAKLTSTANQEGS